MAWRNIVTAPRLTALALAMNVALSLAAHAEGFRFENVTSLEAMRDFIMQNLPRGTRRSVVRRTFVDEGSATFQLHPSPKRERYHEKYTYNINLCRLYVWRWNISANFNHGKRLNQIFVNGEALFPNSEPQWTSKTASKTGLPREIEATSKPRPQADLGVSSVSFVLLRVDPHTSFLPKEFAIGVGPARADPNGLRAIHIYPDVERWRSIFDAEKDEPVHDYTGQCPSLPSFAPAGATPIKASLAD